MNLYIIRYLYYFFIHPPVSFFFARMFTVAGREKTGHPGMPGRSLWYQVSVQLFPGFGLFHDLAAAQDAVEDAQRGAVVFDDHRVVAEADLICVRSIGNHERRDGSVVQKLFLFQLWHI